MTNLEQSMADICAKYGLRNIGVQHFARDVYCPMFYCINLHWATSGHASGTGVTIAEAMADAFQNMAKERYSAPVLADEALELVA